MWAWDGSETAALLVLPDFAPDGLEVTTVKLAWQRDVFSLRDGLGNPVLHRCVGELAAKSTRTVSRPSLVARSTSVMSALFADVHNAAPLELETEDALALRT